MKVFLTISKKITEVNLFVEKIMKKICPASAVQL